MVQLLKLEIEGFGKFDKEKIVKFEEGVNFITGLNEAGKSTILEAIVASIFKYSKMQIEPFFCWKNKNICKTALTYKTDKGEEFRISTDYKSNKRKLEEIKKGKLKEIANVDKTIDPYLREHFGFDDKKVFENTAFIRQSQMAILQDNSVRNKIKDMIEEVFAGRSEASATKSLARMKKIIKDSSKEIDLFEVEQKELKEKLGSAEETKESVVKDSGEFEKINKNLDEKIKEFEKLQKNKKLFDEKEKLINDQSHIDEQIEKVEELVETLSEEREPEQESSPNKTTGIVMIVLGALISLTIIGAIIGIPLIIFGIKKLKEKEIKSSIPKTDHGSKLAKYQKEKKELINKKAVIEDRLENYKLVNFDVDDFDNLEDLKQEVDFLKQRKVELQTSIKTTTSLVDSPEEIREEVDAIEGKKLDLLRKIQEHELASKYLELAESVVHNKFTPAIEKNSKSILKDITNERYSELKIEDETLDIKVKAPETKEYVDVFLLSQGARDQLYFTLRTVMSDLLGGNTNIPLILDDPFHNFDDSRLKKTIEAIKQISKGKQVILISHRPYHQEFKNLAVNVLELK